MRTVFAAAVAAALSCACTGDAGADLACAPLWECRLGAPEGGVADGLLSDVDGDGLPEVIVCHGGRRCRGGVIVLEGADGTERWRADYDGWPRIVTADLDGDGASEIVIARADSLAVRRGADGVTLGAVQIRGHVGELAAGHLDADGTPDLVYTAGSERDDVLVVLSGADLSERWLRAAEREDGPFGVGFSKLTVGDVDGNGVDEVLVTENTNVLLCLAAGGERAWSTVLGGKSRLVPEGVASSRPVVADLTGDGRNEVAIGCFAGALVMIEAKSGDVLERTRYGVESHERHLAGGRVPGFMRELLLSTGEPISELRAVDLDGRPGCELVFGCSDGSVYATSPRTGLRMWASGVEATVYEACIPFPPADAEAPALIAWDVKGVYLMCGADGRRLSGLPPIEGASCVLAGDLKGDGSLDIVVLERGGRTAGAWTTDVAVSAARSLSGGVNDAGASVHLSTPARQR